jgi:histidinol-phosphate/aromatic aminotransferase/cobyric acid decarboxylase-like protein
MRIEEFLRVRDELRASRAGLIDCAELNLYRSLARLDPVGFGAIAPSEDPRAQYRCHVAEELLARLGLEERWKTRAQVSHGVRRSLRVLFGVLAARGGTIAVPDDVYPVYGQLAAEAGVGVVWWSARAGLPDERVLAGVSALLVCEPLKPWGRTLDGDEVERLRDWASADLGRMLILDSAYAIPPSAGALSLMHDELGVVLVSLSKGWLIPDHVGLCIVPERWRELARGAFSRVAKEEARLRIGFAALSEHGDRCQRVADVLRGLGERLDALSRGRPELATSRCVGYFAVSELSFEALLERGVLGVPASVFGGAGGCVLSSLPPVSESAF